MAQLVVCYTIGDECSWSADITRCVEYDSPEAFLVNFELALKAAIDRYEAADEVHRKAVEQIMEAVRLGKAALPANDSWPPIPVAESKFVFAGAEFNIDEFSRYDEKSHRRIAPSDLSPEVYELFDWWLQHKERR